MNNYNYLKLITFIFIIFFIQLITSCSKTKEEIIEKNTYEIYSIIIDKIIEKGLEQYKSDKQNDIVEKNSIPPNTIVIQHLTWDISYYEGQAFFRSNPKEELAGLKERMKTLKNETFYNFVKVNSNKDTLYNKFELMNKSFKVKIIGDSLLKDIFLVQTGWDVFYNKFPNSLGTISLSKVGFDSEGKQALLILARQQGWTNGSGTYLLFEKKANKWVVSSSVSIWIS